MDKQVKAEWVAALRSGEYEQGKGYLQVGGKYCCLGVLCNLAAQHGMGEWRHADGGVGVEFYPMDETGSGFAVLPSAVQDWAGLYENDPIIGGVGGASLGELNDGGSSFAEIADVIEREL